jgi:putative transferase (TIGR04331 family)
MSRIARYLITTADERTWKLDQPVIFLGEWCRLYDRRHVWQNMDAITAAPYGLGAAKKNSDYVKARALEQILFPELCAVLNGANHTTHGERYWRIVLGHWFERLINILHNRFNTLTQCLSNHNVTGTMGLYNNDYTLSTQTTNEAVLACNDEIWNNMLNSRILELMGRSNIIDRVFCQFENEGHANKQSNQTLAFKQRAIKRGLQAYGLISRRFIRKRDALIINSYLPQKEEMKLEIALGQLPQIWRATAYNPVITIPNYVLRKKLSQRFSGDTQNEVERITRALVFETLPICFLEDFIELNNLVNRLPWPTNPKFIFTSNNFGGDEVFKIWTAQKVEGGCMYIVGQHGNNYGTSRHHVNPSIEEITSDKFLTWGWVDGLSQHTPAFNFKIANRGRPKCNPNGGLLLIEVCNNHRLTLWDETSEFSDYLGEQFAMVSKLRKEVKQVLTIRLHAEWRRHNWNELARWAAFDSSINVDSGERNIRELLSENRLIVHSYDSTGMLETLAQDLPTLAFWQNGFDHLRDTAKPHYQYLVDVGIVHLTPDSLAQKINEIWEDVEGWWNGANIKDAKNRFCAVFSKHACKPVHELRRLLTNEEGSSSD